MYDGYYEEMGIEADAVVLNMGDITWNNLKKIIDIMEGENPRQENQHAIKRIEAFLKKHFA